MRLGGVRWILLFHLLSNFEEAKCCFAESFSFGGWWGRRGGCPQDHSFFLVEEEFLIQEFGKKKKHGSSSRFCDYVSVDWELFGFTFVAIIALSFWYLLDCIGEDGRVECLTFLGGGEQLWSKLDWAALYCCCTSIAVEVWAHGLRRTCNLTNKHCLIQITDNNLASCSSN